MMRKKKQKIKTDDKITFDRMSVNRYYADGPSEFILRFNVGEKVKPRKLANLLRDVDELFLEKKED